jgi:phage anti-repressor protein
MKNLISTQSTNLINVIDIIINDIPMKGCNARDLHVFLENGDEFSHWIKDRVCQYDFQENHDFVCVWENTQTQRKDGQKGVSKRKDYHITLGMAKELAMVERNDQGKAARKYFIECEKQLLESKGHLVPHNHIETITPSEQQILAEMVEKKTHGYGDLVGKARAEVWSRVHHKFRVAKYSQLARTQISDVIAYIMQMQIKIAMPSQVISNAQYYELRNACNRAIVGWCFQQSDVDMLMNAIRVHYNIQSLQHLPADKFDEAMAIVDRAKQAANQCLAGIAEIKDYLVKDVICGGAPYTPVIVRKYKQQFGELPAVIDWAKMQQQLMAA